MAKSSPPLAESYPAICKEWHPSRNGLLTPYDIASGSRKRIWWLCEKGHEWQAYIYSRVNGTGCPFCSARLATAENNLFIVNPILSEEWHPEKNGSLTPKDVKANSHKKVWWLCKSGHEWQAQIKSRNKGRGCPFCSGKYPSPDYCLAKVDSNLAKEFHPTKNLPLTAKDLTPNSGKKVWWKCKYGHEWRAVVDNRRKGKGCPHCDGRAVSENNCLQTVNPKLASEWNNIKNKNLTPHDVTLFSNRKVWWICKNYHEWQAIVSHRAKGSGCPYCSNKKVCDDNCLATINPELASEWHPQKNDKLTPRDVVPKSHKKVWWLCLKGHEWQASVYHRSLGNRCPFCYSYATELELRIFSEMKSLFKETKFREKIFGKECDIYVPDIKLGIEVDGEYWHRNRYTEDKNKSSFLEKYGIKVIRVREAGLPKISKNDIYFPKNFNRFQLISQILQKIQRDYNLNVHQMIRIQKYIERGKLKNNEMFLKLLEFLPKPFPGNSLFDQSSKLSLEWHPLKNGPLTPKDVTPKSGRKVWWICKKGHEWEAVINSRTRGNNCPYCSGKKVCNDNSLQSVNPKLALEWHPIKNEKLKPNDIAPNARKRVWWLCSTGHEWQAWVYSRNRGSGCPYCAGQVATEENNLLLKNPILSDEWNYKKNRSLTPKDVTPKSNKRVWWICKNGHEWEAYISNRAKGQGCPYCLGKGHFK